MMVVCLLSSQIQRPARRRVPFVSTADQTVNTLGSRTVPLLRPRGRVSPLGELSFNNPYCFIYVNVSVFPYPCSLYFM